MRWDRLCRAHDSWRHAICKRNAQISWIKRHCVEPCFHLAGVQWHCHKYLHIKTENRAPTPAPLSLPPSLKVTAFTVIARPPLSQRTRDANQRATVATNHSLLPPENHFFFTVFHPNSQPLPHYLLYNHTKNYKLLKPLNYSPPPPVFATHFPAPS